MMKILLTLALMTGAASAEQRTFYDSRGNVIGRSLTDSSGIDDELLFQRQGDQPQINEQQHDEDL